MGIIFVAYGDREGRFDVLEFAVDQSASSDHDLLIYHILESPETSAKTVRTEIEQAMERMNPYIVYDIRIDELADRSTGSGETKSERIVDAISQPTQSFEYVVMGEIQRGPIESLTHSSLTRAVLKEGHVLVMPVPI